jgi:hypothetical protein
MPSATEASANRAIRVGRPPPPPDVPSLHGGGNGPKMARIGRANSGYAGWPRPPPWCCRRPTSCPRAQERGFWRCDAASSWSRRDAARRTWRCDTATTRRRCDAARRRRWRDAATRSRCMARCRYTMTTVRCRHLDDGAVGAGLRRGGHALAIARRARST